MLNFPNASFNMLLSPTASLIVNSKVKDILFDSNLKWFVDCEWYLRVFFKIKKLKLKIKFAISQELYPFILLTVLRHHYQKI